MAEDTKKTAEAEEKELNPEETAEKPEPTDTSETAADAKEENNPEDAPDEDAADAVENAAESDQETAEDAEDTDAADASDEENAANDSEEKKGEKKSGFFKKKKDKKDEQIADLTDRLQRQMAEFDNFRKRTEKEKASMFQMGSKDVIEKILPVVDNFERGLAGADENDPFVDGMNKIYKQMMTVLSDLGVEPIEAEGKEFDPNLHNAVMHEDNPDVGENIVTMDLQKGYTYKDTVVRHSMVKVAN